MATGVISAPPPAARGNFNICARLRGRPDQLGYFACCCRPGEAASILGVALRVAPWTERLRYLVAVRPALQSPSVARA